jgi:diguanylate cyclase (GGDEF)-like protein
MISLKKYLDLEVDGSPSHSTPDEPTLVAAAIGAYRSALVEMGNSCVDACPALGGELKQSLTLNEKQLAANVTLDSVANAETSVQQCLRVWGRHTALHYEQKTREVRELLVTMAHTAESVGERDQRCATQIDNVTARLRMIATLDDLTLIRSSIESSAAELKASIDNMTAEGKAALDHLRKEVSHYQIRLEEAENIATRDALTGLRTRLWVENQIERRISLNLPSCVAILDIDGFKKVNDVHGHLVGDALLRQFSAELKAACRATDIIGRWGGDEFIILLDCDLSQACAQTDRLRQWVTGTYTVPGRRGPLKLRVDASLGLAEHLPDETMSDLFSRADAEMYRFKTARRANGAGRRDKLPGLHDARLAAAPH